ncbi:MAG: RNA-binding cell elongation regulator Jag/EloR [Acidimicrobiales bacterium]
MEWVETTAKTVEQAKELALDQLHVEASDAEFEIIEEPRPGLFGRTRGEARVRARVRPVAPRPKVDRRERRRQGGRKGGQKAERGGSESTSSPTEDAPDTDTDTDIETGTETTAAPARRSRSQSRGPRQASPRAGGSSRRPDDDHPTKETDMNDSATVQEQAEMIREFVDGLVEAFGYDAEVGVVEIDEETAEVQVDGSDLGLLVGPRGNTLQAIHDLSRTVVQRRATGNHEGRVRLDVAGYRERRRQALERFTQKLADEVLATGVAQVLEPMSSADRKVVHDTANEIDGVRTTSEGEDARRHVVILPDG